MEAILTSPTHCTRRATGLDTTKLRSTAIRWFIAGGSLLFLTAGLATAAELSGSDLYRLHCASCHGTTGRGDGPDTAIFATPPPDLRTGFLSRYATDELVRRVRDGQPAQLALDPDALRARAGEVEELVAYLRRLPSLDWARIAAGRNLYAARCESCHGVRGHAPPTLPSGVRPPRDLSDPRFQRGVDDAQMALVVRHGRHGMPALTPRVSEADARPLAAFVRVLSPGFVMYSRYCANCHGEDGRGATVASGRPAVVFDRGYFARQDPDELRKNIWHMVAEQEPKMPHYGATLSEAQARAIVDYLKSSQ